MPAPGERLMTKTRGNFSAAHAGRGELAAAAKKFGKGDF
jgi:hypothetical protein